MHFLTAAFPGTGVDLLKDPTWNRPVNLLKVLDLGYTYATSAGSMSRRKRKTTGKPTPDLPTPAIPISELRQMISSRHATQPQINLWENDGLCFFESSKLTEKQLEQCIRRRTVVSSYASGLHLN
jgi:hypothetical protein